MRSVWNNDLPPAVCVLTKNVRGHPVALFGSDGLEGFDIAAAKALHSLQTHSARLKSCPDTNSDLRKFPYRRVSGVFPLSGSICTSNSLAFVSLLTILIVARYFFALRKTRDVPPTVPHPFSDGNSTQFDIHDV